MISIPLPLQQFHKQSALRLAMAYELTRTDSTVFRYTNHDSIITLDDGNDYTPAAGFSDSAFSQDLNLRNDPAVEIVGVLADSNITHDDLRAGLYRNATVVLSWVNWLYPWAGSLIEYTYLVQKLHFTGDIWNAEIVGISSKLNGTIGKLYTRLCPYDFGDSDCTKVVSADSDTVTTVTTQRRVFTSSGLASSQSDDYYKWGKLTWTSGNNNGIISEVKGYVDATGTVTLRTPTPFDIAASDGFDILVGCDKTRGVCNTKFSNLVNHGGFPFLPGYDAGLPTIRGIGN
jgi:uncharacterized phage protein (TIGR02218 family)